ncbi:MAG TPA: anti-virulence regulator CigR family protein [Gemmatimonadales bacterium]|nr:anti-virulence regulator CigR family protein [Gemmatimonadales bacterium]
MSRSATLLSLALLFGVTVPALAQKPDKGKGQHHTVAAAHVDSPFSSHEREVIKLYYAEHRATARPLPPGIAKNLARGKPLPPGIAKQQVPQGLRAELPTRGGMDVLIIGDRIVLVDPVGLVVDVLNDIF